MPPYDPANWTWAIVSDSGGGPSFTGDDLTVSSAPGTLVISATHNETGAPAMATISVVAAIVLTPVLEGLPAEVVQGEDYQLSAEVQNSDGSVNESYNPANWTFAVLSGPATFTGPNSDILSINAGSAPDSVSVQATHISEGTTAPATAGVIAPPGPDFPETLEPSNMVVVLANQGDTKNFGAGWTPQQSWGEASKLAVVADVDSKYGNALEKRSALGESNWLNAYNQGNFVANHREIYARYVFRLSSNWQRNAQETVFQYGRKLPGQSVDQFALMLSQGTPGLRWSNSLTGAEVGDGSRNGVYEANTPSISVLSKDEYHTLELLHRLNSAGNADGYLIYALPWMVWRSRRGTSGAAKTMSTFGPA